MRRSRRQGQTGAERMWLQPVRATNGRPALKKG
jgi:hypothetical protein